jgi:hypothetical protein
MNEISVDVCPVKCALLGMPDCPLTANVSRWDNAADFALIFIHSRLDIDHHNSHFCRTTLATRKA